jgi:4,5-DOPA dioxygenase extradiol
MTTARPAAGGRIPTWFLGHGSPMNALATDGAYAKALESLGKTTPRPRAVLMISAHWRTDGVRVHVAPQPKMLYDFLGFPAALMQVRYGAAGDPALAAQVIQLLAEFGAQPDETWGLDHGAWSPLRHVYPAADVPVVMLSLDLKRPRDQHWAIGRKLAPLASDGVLIIGSGNVVHNLRGLTGDEASPPPTEAKTFADEVGKRVAAGNPSELLKRGALKERGETYSIPSEDHFLPFLYAWAAAGEGAKGEPIYTAYEYGGIAMHSWRFVGGRA